jgi:ferredoxin
VENVKEKIKDLLGSGEIKGFMGLCKKNGHIGPHLFCDEKDLDNMAIGDLEGPGDTRYPLNKQLIHLARCYPEETFGVLVRGCDERGLKALFVWNQLRPEKVVPVGIACPLELAEACECLKPDNLDLKGRFAHWMKEFDRCIKCYGCRDICPMCFCKECSLETDALIHTGELPPESPIFHLTRAVHMAGRCIDCGLCLRTLYKKVADILDEEFQYRTGYAADEKSPLNILGEAPEE